MTIEDFPIEAWIDIQRVSDELDQEAEDSVLPQRLTARGEPDEPLVEVIFCDMISGGADYVDNMPRTLSLIRKLADGSEYRATYHIATTYHKSDS